MARKRKPGPRAKSGRLSRANKAPAPRDNGTEEGQVKRQRRVGENGDPALAESACGILFAHGHLDRDQYTEALEYRRLRCAIYGPPWPSNAVSGDISEPYLTKLKARFEVKVALLTPEQKHVVTAVCVFDAIPSWFFAERLKLNMLPEDHEERELLITGLNALVGGGGQRRAA